MDDSDLTELRSLVGQHAKLVYEAVQAGAVDELPHESQLYAKAVQEHMHLKHIHNALEFADLRDGAPYEITIEGETVSPMAHIAAHSTAHSDGILTRTDAHAARFIAEVDSAAVYVNASTRFTDGGQFGLGAEVAISTQRLHARGPMGLRELTTYKWVVVGNGHVRP